MMPSMDFKGAFSTAPTSGNLGVQSEPPGAEAKASTGPTCKTPCTLEVPGSGEFTVSLALTGYKPQTVTVKPVPAEGNAFSMGPTTVKYDPSPVMAQLEPLAPPKGKRKSAPKPKTSAAMKSTADMPPATQ
jgi:hypothetical protein